MTRAQANMLLLLAGVIWGMGFVAQSTAMASIGPFLFIGIRSAIAALTVLPWAIAEGRRTRTRLRAGNYIYFMIVGATLFTGLTLQQIGLITTSVTNAGFLTGLYVVMVPVLGVIFFRTWPHPIVWPCAAACLAGIFLLSGGELTALKQGDVLVICGAVFWAMQVVLIGRANRAGRPVTLSCVQFATSAMAGLVIASMIEDFNWNAIALTWKEILFTGVFSSGVAFTLQAIGQRYTTSAQAAIFLSSEALFAALFGAIFLGDRLTFIGFIGCGLLFAAMLAVEIIPMFWKRKPGSLNPMAEAAE
ncbi:DMT family transporter [Brucella inopinata]|uniref:DMT family transporter n=1 Tax=Brucella inopinata TaxID=1218315 RepID=A0AAW7B026_9HYPH|nr:DMT family transporter [Brucella inopinata]EFM56875.1 transporter, DME family protein [Brucella inopinata BO1]MDL2332485.1 DMT family transporter [Brucella inopinata]